jgi:hypothetical protein
LQVIEEEAVDGQDVVVVVEIALIPVVINNNSMILLYNSIRKWVIKVNNKL